MRIFVPFEDGPYMGSMRLVPYQPGLACEHALRQAPELAEHQAVAESSSRRTAASSSVDLRVAREPVAVE
jgi:hypothetical protein